MRFLVFIFFAVVTCTFANAQKNDYPALVKTGKAVADFVPQNWVIYAITTGDLNKDKHNDVALILQKDDSTFYIKNKKGEIIADSNPRMLLVLFFNPATKNYSLVEYSTSFITRHTDAQKLDPFQSLTIKNGIMSVGMCQTTTNDSKLAKEASYKFRYQNKAFEMIGAELLSYTRSTGESVDYSFNFSIRSVIISKGNFKSNKDPLQETKKIILPQLYTLKTFTQPFSLKIEGAIL